ncbi:MAG: SDR family NAD(P)-dependent oxidoreductase [Actinomycetota bacterium]
MRAFVTGATGFIGGHVARRLVERGWQVTALARSPERTGALKQLGITVVPGDVTEPSSLSGPMTKADAVFHLAAWYQLGVRDRMKMFQINVKGTENVMDAAADAEVPKIVYCSSVAALGTHEPGEIPDETHRHTGNYGSVYEETKFLAHQRVHEFVVEDVPIVTVMPGGVYGPGDTSILGTLIRFYSKGWLLAAPFMESGVSWVRVEDVADGVIDAHDKGRPGEDYILGGDNATIRELLRRAAVLTGIRVPRINVGKRLMTASLPLAPLLGKILGQPPGILRDGLESLSGSLEYSSDKARREIGYTFRSIEEGFPETVEWYKANT